MTLVPRGNAAQSATALAWSAALAASAAAQCVPDVLSLSGPFNSPIRAMTIYNGELIAGGNFTLYQNALGIARWNGLTWSALGSGIPSGTVRALTPHAGQLIAAGSFNTAGGVTVNGTARWNGSAWQALGSGVQSVEALTSSGPDVIAGGSFATAGGVSARAVARWDGAAWNAMSTGLGDPFGGSGPGTVRSLIVFSGSVIAGGFFRVGSQFHIARWTGSTWEALGGGINSEVHALAIHNSELIVAGEFTSAGGTPGTPVHKVARWTGSAWQPIGNGGIGNDVQSVASHAGTIFIGGRFTTAGGIPAAHLAMLVNGTWQPCGGGTNGLSVYTLQSYLGELAIGGDFSLPALNWTRWACPCYADCNASAGLTIADFACFQSQFAAQHAYADCNADGQRTIADFGCFQTKFSTGCP